MEPGRLSPRREDRDRDRETGTETERCGQRQGDGVRDREMETEPGRRSQRRGDGTRDGETEPEMGRWSQRWGDRGRDGETETETERWGQRQGDRARDRETETGRWRQSRGDGDGDRGTEMGRWSQKEVGVQQKGLKVTIGVTALQGAWWLDPQRCSGQCDPVLINLHSFPTTEAPARLTSGRGDHWPRLREEGRLLGSPPSWLYGAGRAPASTHGSMFTLSPAQAPRGSQ